MLSFAKIVHLVRLMVGNSFIFLSVESLGIKMFQKMSDMCGTITLVAQNFGKRRCSLPRSWKQVIF
jgi:hypothetical protein